MVDAPGERPWCWEGHVQDALAVYLAADGWDVREAANTEAKAPGIDLLATKDHRCLAIEVNGYPNTTYDHRPSEASQSQRSQRTRLNSGSRTRCSG